MSNYETKLALNDKNTIRKTYNTKSICDRLSVEKVLRRGGSLWKKSIPSLNKFCEVPFPIKKINKNHTLNFSLKEVIEPIMDENCIAEKPTLKLLSKIVGRSRKTNKDLSNTLSCNHLKIPARVNNLLKFRNTTSKNEINNYTTVNNINNENLQRIEELKPYSHEEKMYLINKSSAKISNENNHIKQLVNIGKFDSLELTKIIKERIEYHEENTKKLGKFINFNCNSFQSALPLYNMSDKHNKLLRKKSKRDSNLFKKKGIKRNEVLNLKCLCLI